MRVLGVLDLLTSQGLSLSPVSNQATECLPLADAADRAAAAQADMALGVGRVMRESDCQWSLIFNLRPWDTPGSHDDMASKERLCH